MAKIGVISASLKSDTQIRSCRHFSYKVLHLPCYQILKHQITREEFNLLEDILKKCVTTSDTEQKIIDNLPSEISLNKFKTAEFTIEELKTLDSILKKCVIALDGDEQPKIGCNLWPTGIIYINPEKLADHLEDLCRFLPKLHNGEEEYAIIFFDRLITAFADKDNPKDNPYKNGYERASFFTSCMLIANIFEEQFKNKKLTLKNNEDLTNSPLQQFHIPYACHNDFNGLNTIIENLKKQAQLSQLNKTGPQLL